jgi:hypothetical protein
VNIEKGDFGLPFYLTDLAVMPMNIVLLLLGNLSYNEESYFYFFNVFVCGAFSSAGMH